MSIYKSNSSYLYNDSNQGYSHSYIVPTVIKILKDFKNLRILELGCGNGYFCNVLTEMGHKVVGVDVSGTGIEIANKSFPGIRFIKSDVYDLLTNPILDGESFDVVIAIEVIEHLRYPREFIKVAKKYLKREGLLLISTPYHGYLKNLAISLLNKWDNHFSVSWDVGHIKFFSVSTLRKMLVREGFNDISFRFSGRLPAFWKSMICIGKIIRT